MGHFVVVGGGDVVFSVRHRQEDRRGQEVASKCARVETEKWNGVEDEIKDEIRMIEEEQGSHKKFSVREIVGDWNGTPVACEVGGAWKADGRENWALVYVQTFTVELPSLYLDGPDGLVSRWSSW